MKVKGRWTYLYRAVDSRGQTIDFLLSAKRDAEAAKRFFRKALAQPHTVNPRTITVDKNATRPKALRPPPRRDYLLYCLMVTPAKAATSVRSSSFSRRNFAVRTDQPSHCF